MAATARVYGHLIACLDTYFDMDLDRCDLSKETEKFLEAIHESVKTLRLPVAIVDDHEKVGGVAGLRSLLLGATKVPYVFDYLCGLYAMDVLYRLEDKADRMASLVEILPDADAPARSQRFLAEIADCYLLGLDTECIAMCRGVVEVLAEELEGEETHMQLGALIKKLEREDKISEEQADDMWEVNRQAKEVLHDIVHRRPPDASDCVQRITRLLSQLHPADW